MEVIGTKYKHGQRGVVSLHDTVCYLQAYRNPTCQQLRNYGHISFSTKFSARWVTSSYSLYHSYFIMANKYCRCCCIGLWRSNQQRKKQLYRAAEQLCLYDCCTSVCVAYVFFSCIHFCEVIMNNENNQDRSCTSGNLYIRKTQPPSFVRSLQSPLL